MKRIATIALAVVGAGFLVIGGGVAAFANFGKDNHFERMIERVDRKLDLSDSQRDSLEKMAGEAREFIREKHRARANEMADLWRRDKINADDVAAVIRARKENRDERHNFIAVKAAEFHAILTPQQREKMAEEMPHWIGKFAKRGWGYHRKKHRDRDDD